MTRKIILAALIVALGGVCFALVCALAQEAAGPIREAAYPVVAKEVKIERGLTEMEKECISCHAKEQPGRVHDWSRSVMARANITCLDCHLAQSTDKDAADCPGTRKYPGIKISPVVTPADCGKCHPREADQFARSKHARTFEIQTKEIKDPWLKGMANAIERAAGCWVCHGSDLRSGRLDPENWPNEGCGRLNPDGSHGSCVICHTAHHFSIAEARKPENCGQCHLGPDHPQDEIYFESKHGKRYLADQASWDFEAAPDAWEPSAHYTAPTCAVCHISGTGPLATTHDVGERLKWESQAGLSILNKDHDAAQAREKMAIVCKQCHSPHWSDNYLARYDEVMNNYNENYMKPAQVVMNGLYQKGLLTEWPVFDEEIEWVFYEFWHHEGRRARMGAMMMGPDYSWWHGFYELKRHYQDLIRLANEAEEKGHGDPVYVPGAGGPNLTPVELTPLEKRWTEIENLSGRPEKK